MSAPARTSAPIAPQLPRGKLRQHRRAMRGNSHVVGPRRRRWTRCHPCADARTGARGQRGRASDRGVRRHARLPARPPPRAEIGCPGTSHSNRHCLPPAVVAVQHGRNDCRRIRLAKPGDSYSLELAAVSALMRRYNFKASIHSRTEEPLTSNFWAKTLATIFSFSTRRQAIAASVCASMLCRSASASSSNRKTRVASAFFESTRTCRLAAARLNLQTVILDTDRG